MEGLLPYFTYLIPTDQIQEVFLAIIVFLSVGTAVWVKLCTWQRKGKTNCWEKRWTNNTPTDETDDLKTEHGSVQELCDAVALPAEKLAEVLPSMLLVVGLMGTFLGVGVALNDAASVLKDSERPPMEMLQEMVSMLDGLGALFKSSIYGIIGFFAFTFWRNRWGSDEKRFNWCVTQCNKELANKKSEIEKFQEIQETNTQTIIVALNQVNQSIGKSIADCIQKSLQSALVAGFNELNKNLEKVNQNVNDNLINMNTNVNKNLTSMSSDLVKNLTTMNDSVNNNLTSINKDFTEKITSMNKNVNSNLTSINKDLVEKLSSMNSALCYALEKTVVEKFNELQDQMKKQISETSSIVSNLSDLTDKTSAQAEAMASLTTTMESQFTKVADSASSMGHAATNLSKSVDEFSPAVQKALDSIQEKFVASITKSGQIMNDAGTSIRTAVEEMSKENSAGQKNLDETLKDFSQKIGRVTVDIQGASMDMGLTCTNTTDTLKNLGQTIDKYLKDICLANLSVGEATKNLPNLVANSIKAPLDVVKSTIESAAENNTSALNNKLAPLSQEFKNTNLVLERVSESNIKALNAGFSSLSQELKNTNQVLKEVSVNTNEREA